MKSLTVSAMAELLCCHGGSKCRAQRAETSVLSQRNLFSASHGQTTVYHSVKWYSAIAVHRRGHGCRCALGRFARQRQLRLGQVASVLVPPTHPQAHFACG